MTGALAGAASGAAWAQGSISPEAPRRAPRYVFSQAVTTGLYFGADLQALPVLGRPVAGGAISTGVTLNECWMLGVYWQGQGAGQVLAPAEPLAASAPRATLYQTEFGLEAARWFTPERPLHPVVHLRAGWGNARWWGLDPAQAPSSADFVSLTPMAGLQANLTYWARLDALVGYRAVGALRLEGLPPQALSGPVLSLQLRIGIFDRTGQGKLERDVSEHFDW